MNNTKELFYYYALGEFAAKVMLRGIVHPDMQHENIGFDGQNFRFVDHAEIHTIAMPNELSEDTVRQLTTSLFPLIKPFMKDFTCMSYFRAGFTSFGGVLGHILFSNTTNMGVSSFRYVCDDAANISYDASFLYTNEDISSAIIEWNHCPLEKITLQGFPSLDAYNFSNERCSVSPFTMFYIDNLYFVRCYLGLSQVKEAVSQLPILVLNMATSAQHFGLKYTAYGLYQKALTMRSSIDEVNSMCVNALKTLSSSVLNDAIISFINSCTEFDLLELLWILDDLDKPLPPDVRFQMKYTKSDAKLFTDIAPELTGDPLYIVTGAELGLYEDGDEFAEYLENVKDKYQTIKTLLYSETPKLFYDFYVCNRLTYKVSTGRNSYIRKTIHDVTASILNDCANFVIITGTGGLGKSMMMRHLLLDCIKIHDTTQKLPIFIPLKDFDDSYDDLMQYVYEKFDALGGNKDIDEFEEILANGRCLLLFDGLDEIHSSVRKFFEKKLDIFADKYSDNMFVISSRPAMSFVAFNRFTVFELQPFDKVQALQLIDKLEFRTDDPTIKATFRKKLDEDLYFSHREFAENPLLLTIMLMTFEQFAEVPSKMHIFYREAYITLSQKHDATKGAYKRALNTGVSADRFSEYFAEFCARTYCDEKFDFTDEDFERYYSAMTEPKKDRNTASTSDFIIDVVSNMCLMYQESRKYHFTHRSFQEYFCALYFSKQKDKNLGAIGDVFEHKRSRFSQDKTFHMLYDMIPEKIEEYIFLPFLQKLFDECDTQDGYWTFLQKIYPTIQYDKGDADSAENEPESFLFSFIASVRGFNGFHYFSDFPEEDDFLTGEWVQLDDEYMQYNLEYHGETIPKDDVPWEYIHELGFDEPEVIGCNYEFNVKDICRNPIKYKIFEEIINDDCFAYKEEYVAAREYMEQLIKKQNPKSTNLFDLFQ